MADPSIDLDLLGSAFAALQDSSDDAFIIASLDGRIVSWGHGATRLFGYDADEMSGAPLVRLWPDGQDESVASQLLRVREGRRVEQFETLRVGKTGHLIDVSASMWPIRGADGAVVAALVVTRDIRLQKRADGALSQIRARWRTLLDSAVDGIIVIDARGRIEAFNQAAQRMFGYGEDEIIGKNVSVLMPSPYREEHDGYLARYLREGEARIIGVGRDVTGRHRDGTTFPLHLAVGEMSLDGERKFTGILHDLTGRVRLEEQLRRQAALAHLGEMAAVIAHEVKNPLAGIRGAIQVIANRANVDSPERSITAEIVARIDALSDMMSDMLLFARPPKPRLAPVDVEPLITATAELLTAAPALRAVSVTVEGSAPPVPADRELLKIVFENVLVNSAQAMRGTGAIQVSIRATDNACRMVFGDQGPGIPADVLDKVFTPFFTTKAKGTGLGLPTCRRLIEAHRGSIAIACPAGGGTEVTIELPLRP